ncbi:tetratricopeptide repeat protein [Virgibacillus sp. NKC19-16]|nr:tetratricopeptide repeat protein [Virgibacillus sp. NKC19-16]
MTSQEVEEHLLSLGEQIKAHVNGKGYELAWEQVEELEEILDSDEKIDEEVQFLSLRMMAKFYHTVKNYDKTKNYSKRALHIKEMDKTHTELVIDTYLDYAGLEREHGQFSNARKLLKELLGLLESTDWQDAYYYGLVYRSLGMVEVDEGDDESALRNLEKALTYFRESVAEENSIIGQTVYAISDIYIRLEDYDQALHLHQQLLETYQQIGDKVSEGKSLLKIGEVYFYIDAKKSRRTITQAVKLFGEVYEDKHIDIAKGNLLLGELDETMGGIPRALKYYKRSLEQMDRFYSESHFLTVYAYSKIGTLSITVNEWDHAEEYLEKGLALSDPFPKMRRQFLHALGEFIPKKQPMIKHFLIFRNSCKDLSKMEAINRRDMRIPFRILDLI